MIRPLPRRVALSGVSLAAAVVLLLVIAVGTGEFSIAPGDVVATLFGGGDPSTRFVVETIRLPRALCALLVGAALGASGAVFQTLTRNPLGSPDVIGVVQGSAAAAVLLIVLSGDVGTGGVAVGAMAGGLAASALVYVLALRNGVVAGYRLLLVGIGVGAILVALTDYGLTRASFEQAQAAQTWLTGSLNGRGWEHVWPVAIALGVLLPALAVLVGPLKTLELGDDAAAALGVRVEATRLAVLTVAVLLCAVATAATGPVVFVALAAPQIARRVTLASGPGVGSAALMGAVLLLAADVLAQRALSADLPVGVVTGVLGGGYLVWLLVRERVR